jgi:hypothetical protein
MAESWLAPGENIVGSWSVFLGDPGVSSAKITGKLFVTNAHVHFEAGLSLKENAASLIAQRIKPYEKLENHIVIPFAEIAGVQSVKKSFLTKALAVKLKSGAELEFQFGAASPQKAAEAIAAKL